MAWTVLTQVFILSLMILLGYILGKIGFIGKEHSRFLTDLVMDVFFPCNILAAAGSGLGEDGGGLGTALFVIFLYFALLLVYTILGYLLGGILRFPDDQRRIFATRYGRAPEYSSQSMLQSTLLLPLTMPVMMFVAERILLR